MDTTDTTDDETEVVSFPGRVARARQMTMIRDQVGVGGDDGCDISAAMSKRD